MQECSRQTHLHNIGRANASSDSLRYVYTRSSPLSLSLVNRVWVWPHADSGAPSLPEDDYEIPRFSLLKVRTYIHTYMYIQCTCIHVHTLEHLRELRYLVNVQFPLYGRNIIRCGRRYISMGNCCYTTVC